MTQLNNTPNTKGYRSQVGLLIENRCVAGRYLANVLDHYRDHHDVVVLAIPRGGVPIAREIAQNIRAPLDVMVVRKLGCPQQPELAFGALARGGKPLLIPYVIDNLCIDAKTIATITAREEQELNRREQCYRGDKPFPDLQQKTVILVDDGLATGATMHAAIDAVRAHHPAAIIVAVPVASLQATTECRPLVDELVCLATPEPFVSVGQHYRDFNAVSDQEVCALLESWN